MNWQAIIDAIALVLIIEALLPFISPEHYKQTMVRIIEANDSTIRKAAIAALCLGLILLVFS